MCVQSIGAAILASTVLVATTAIGSQHTKSEGNGYDSPQEAGEVFIAAMTKKNWKTGFRCFAREAQDLAVAHLIVTTMFLVAPDQKTQQAAEAHLKKYGFERAKAEEAAKTASIRAEANQAKPDWKPAVKAFVAQIEDKELFFTSTLTWLDEKLGGRGRAADACVLQDLKATGDTATGKLKLTRHEYTVHFRKVDGRWFMVLPEEEYRPSACHDMFLIMFLHAMHGWK